MNHLYCGWPQRWRRVIEIVWWGEEGAGGLVGVSEWRSINELKHSHSHNLLQILEASNNETQIQWRSLAICLCQARIYANVNICTKIFDLPYFNERRRTTHE